MTRKLNRRNFLAATSGALLGQSAALRQWRTPPPDDCPAGRSRDLLGIAFTGRHAEYANADTWYPAWASDGNLYSPWTDGSVNNVRSMSAGRKATTGYATILGDSPLDLTIVNAAVYPGDPTPYSGRYPCGSLVHDGVWYYGTYCLDDSGKGLNWDTLGPLVGFRQSTDFGKTWMDTRHTPSSPLFAEPERQDAPVKMGAPHFVDFGRNMRHSPDGRAYLVGHGAVGSDPKPKPANLSWITGDQIYLARVQPGAGNLNDRSKYEFFAGRNQSGRAIWTRDFGGIQAIFEWNNNAGCVTITLNAPLRKYLMCVTDGGNTIGKFNTYVLESDSVAGPWKLVEYMQAFGVQAYFVNIPSKFISRDGRTCWLMYSANYSNTHHRTDHKPDPPGSRYGMCLQEVTLQ